MSYITVIPLSTAKTFLRIDDTQNETDSEITSMINAACRHVERMTNVIFYARDISYDVVDGHIRVYDSPINSVVSPVEFESIKGKLYTSYTIDSGVDTLVLNVGYTLPSDVPEDLVNVALTLVKLMYFEQETNESFKDAVPGWAKEVLNEKRRFLV